MNIIKNKHELNHTKRNLPHKRASFTYLQKNPESSLDLKNTHIGTAFKATNNKKKIPLPILLMTVESVN